MKIIDLKGHLTVIFDNGEKITRNNCSEEYIQNVKDLQEDEEAVRDFLVPKLKEVRETAKAIETLTNDVARSKHLTKVGSSYYLHDISEISLPTELLMAFTKAEAEGNDKLIQTYKNFWMFASLNPDSRARTNLFWFLQKYGMTISESGLFVAYRNVEIYQEEQFKFVSEEEEYESTEKVVVETEDEEPAEKPAKASETPNYPKGYAEALTREYIRLRTKLKAKASNYLFGILNGEYVMKARKTGEKVLDPVLGEMGELYKDLKKSLEEGKVEKVKDSNQIFKKSKKKGKKKKETKIEKVTKTRTIQKKVSIQPPIYTDSYTKTFRIQIGSPVIMERNLCDLKQENDCSRGLHVAGKGWLGSGYFGAVPLRVLVSPADVVAVPPNDNYGKMRVCTYYPIEVVRFSNGGLVAEDLEDGFDDSFVNIIVDGALKINNEDLGNYKLEIPKIPEINIKTYVSNLKAIKKAIANKEIKKTSK